MQSTQGAVVTASPTLNFDGVVIEGNRIGRTIGFRTANVAAPAAEPSLYGIYSTTVTLQDGRSLAGVSNLGVRPTVGSKEPLLEVHIFDFDEEIYGQRIAATLHDRLRSERRFESLDALKVQLSIDMQTARTLMNTRHAGLTSEACGDAETQVETDAPAVIRDRP